VDWIYLAHDLEQWRPFINNVMAIKKKQISVTERRQAPQEDPCSTQYSVKIQRLSLTEDTLLPHHTTRSVNALDRNNHRLFFESYETHKDTVDKIHRF